MLELDRPAWRTSGADPHPLMGTWRNSIARRGGELTAGLPQLGEPGRLLLATDYGGDHQIAQAPLRCHSFLVVNLEQAHGWDAARRRLRRGQLAQRTMAYKSLADGVKARALPPFLSLADGLNGLLLNVLIEKRGEPYFCDPTLPELTTGPLAGLRAPTAERVLQVVSIIHMLISGFASPGQDMVWVTDRDQIAANPQQHDQTLRLLASLNGEYLPAPHGHLHGATTEHDPVDKQLEDLAAIPDLAAGALCEIARTLPMVPGPEEGVTPLPESLVSKARSIVNWLADTRRPLRRLTYVLGRTPEGKVRLSHIAIPAITSGLLLPAGVSVRLGTPQPWELAGGLILPRGATKPADDDQKNRA